MGNIAEILDLLSTIKEDSSVPRNVRITIDKTIICLREDDTVSVEVNIDKAIQNLDEISSDPNIPIYTRTQIWNAISALESK
tara:strand:+ start:7265 stop:7510 length:246 start_codon:yes stop_codon:yes gene_type:complete